MASAPRAPPRDARLVLSVLNVRAAAFRRSDAGRRFDGPQTRSAKQSVADQAAKDAIERLMRALCSLQQLRGYTRSERAARSRLGAARACRAPRTRGRRPTAGAPPSSAFVDASRPSASACARRRAARPFTKIALLLEARAARQLRDEFSRGIDEDSASRSAPSTGAVEGARPRSRRGNSTTIREGTLASRWHACHGLAEF